MAAAIYSHAVEKMILRGAPVKWKALAPTYARPNAVGLSPRAAHPHAALLFADFILSPQGQTLIKDRSRVPASLAVETTMNKFPFEMIDPVISLDEADKWDKLWSALFLQGRKVSREAE
jgi:iron(III) transport system substrate-binding protein